MSAVFAPNVGQIVVAAFARIQVRRTEITASHMADARNEANLLQVQWGNRGPNLWTVDQQQISVAQGTVTYPILPDTIDVLEMYVSSGYGSDGSADAGADATTLGAFSDRLLTALGRDEYASIPNKLSQSPPTSFWFQKGQAPQVTLYPSPDQAYVIYYWRERQAQTADFANAGSPDTPYLWLDAFVAGLAHRLARIYARPFLPDTKADAEEAWQVAAEQDTERVPLYITPDVSSYYR